MKIKYITIRNNPILWNIELDFRKSDGSISNTILFIGENGSWKSTMLNVIFKFCNYTDPDLWENEERQFIVDLDNWEYRFKYSKSINNNEYYQWSSKSWLNNMSIKKDWKEMKIHDFNTLMNNDNILKAIFSDVSINFSTKNISSTTNLDTDLDIKESIKSWKNTTQEIKQLLVDIDHRDNSDVGKWVDNHSDIPERMKHIRWKRFKNAFDVMFKDEWLEYIYTDAFNPMFKKKWIKIWIDNLSSWEKQIVYRWGFLLKDKNSVFESVILIDEPEISMHPLRQEKILEFYKNLFINDEWVQTSQIFITTHSPYLLQSIDNEKDYIFMLPWWERVDKIRKYLGNKPSLWIVNYRAFHLPTIELFDELYWYIRKNTGIKNEPELENYLVSHGIEKRKKRPNRWGFKDCTLWTFIRNKIHHREIETDKKLNYTQIEFKEAIDWMIEFIEGNGL